LQRGLYDVAFEYHYEQGELGEPVCDDPGTYDLYFAFDHHVCPWFHHLFLPRNHDRLLSIIIGYIASWAPLIHDGLLSKDTIEDGAKRRRMEPRNHPTARGGRGWSAMQIISGSLVVGFTFEDRGIDTALN